jgi:hypothetical protein
MTEDEPTITILYKKYNNGCDWYKKHLISSTWFDFHNMKSIEVPADSEDCEIELMVRVLGYD